MIETERLEGEIMIKGIGLDIIEIKRIEKIMSHQPKFVKRVLTEREKAFFDSLKENRQVEFLAGRFAAKEAFSKAYGTGLGKALRFQDIEITYDEKGRPYIIKPFKEGIHLSITHCKEYAAAQVIIEE